MTWALVELARNPEKQARLREELSTFTTKDPTWEQLTYSLPYLDAIARETIRLHPPVDQTERIVRLLFALCYSLIS